MIPAAVRVRAAPAPSTRRSALLAEHGDDAKLLAGGHSLLPMMKLRLARAGGAGRLGRIAELRYVRVDGDDGRHRRADPARRPGGDSDAAARSEVPLLAARRRPGRRPADPPPRHHRRLAGARRPGRRPAHGACSRCGGDAGRARARAAGARSAPTTSSRATSRPRWSRTRCSSRSGVPRGRASRWGYEKFTRRANDWAIVGVAAVGRPGRAGQHGPGAGARHRDRAGAGRRARPSTEAAALAARGHRPGRGHARRRGVPPAPGPRAHPARARRRGRARLAPARTAGWPGRLDRAVGRERCCPRRVRWCAGA